MSKVLVKKKSTKRFKNTINYITNMSNHFTSPLIEKESSTKDIIIEILSEEFPLSIKKIYNIISKKYRKRVSYQAVHKAVYELLNEKVLVKKRKEYSLSKNYIERLSYFVERLELNYKKERGLFKELSEKNFVIKKLDSQYEMAVFVISVLKNAKKGEVIAIIWPTAWPPLTVPENIYSALKEMGKKAEVYCICGGDGFLDKQFAKRWRELGMNIKLGVKLDRMFETFVLRDLVVLIYQPSEKRMQKYRYINLIKGLTAFDQDKFFLKIIKEKAEIYAFIIRNPAFADKIKQEIMGYF